MMWPMSELLDAPPLGPQQMLLACRRLMDGHGLSAWHLRLSCGRRRMGSCAYHQRTIRLSRHLLQNNAWPVVCDTVLHEIAHALVGEGHQHDAVWRAKARELGATPAATCRDRDLKMPEPPWQAWCPACQVVVGRYHRPPRHWRRGYRHRTCGRKVEFRKKG